MAHSRNSLREARASSGSLEAFIAEHETDPDGDLDKLDAALKRPAQEKSSATQEASSAGGDGDCSDTQTP